MKIPVRLLTIQNLAGLSHVLWLNKPSLKGCLPDAVFVIQDAILERADGVPTRPSFEHIWETQGYPLEWHEWVNDITAPGTCIGGIMETLYMLHTLGLLPEFPPTKP